MRSWNRWARRVLGLSVTVLIGGILVLQAYALWVHPEGEQRVPDDFGNFPNVRAMLQEQQPRKDEFRFAVMGDTRSVGTFEEIVAKLRREPLDFAVLLGDVAYDGTAEDHRYLRAELPEYVLGCPMFFVVGNHDVDVGDEAFTVDDFEREYGPTIFRFDYQGSLFVFLRILDGPHSNQESIAFLEDLQREPLDHYRRRFVFMHIPPPISPDFVARRFDGEERLVELIDALGIDYVYAGDYHGYARSQLNDTTYVVTGGGGAALDDDLGNQFHHALVITVGDELVSERFVHVEKCDHLEDGLERLAQTYVWPTMERNWLMLLPLNFWGIVVVAAMRRRRSEAVRE